MKLPNADNAVIEKEKIVGYLLNPDHPDGAPKAKFFSTFGFDANRWNELADALRQLVQAWPVVNTVVTRHGEKYIVEGTLETPIGG